MPEPQVEEWAFRRGALLDTNILGSLAKSQKAEIFRPVFEFLKGNDCDIFQVDVTIFEMLGFNKSLENFEKVQSFLAPFTIHNTRREDIEGAARMTSIYKVLDNDLNPKQISFADSMYAWQLIKYKDRAMVVTTDIHDYPISLFDIKKIQVINDENRATIVGYITYNAEKWTKGEEIFSRTRRRGD
jgi:predicted nucleic acid-binding protein